MPPWRRRLGTDEDVKDVAHYVLSSPAARPTVCARSRGKAKFATICAACHGADGKGNPASARPT